MRNRRNIIAAVAVAAVIGGCASKPVNIPEFQKARATFEAIKKDPLVNQYATTELFQAGKLYEKAKNATDVAQQRHLSYLLQRESEIAKAHAEAKANKEALIGLKEEKLKAELAKKEGELLVLKKEAQKAKEALRQLQELNAKQTNRGLVLTLGDVLFESGKAKLLPGSARAIEQLAEFLKENPEREVLIEGHTDNVGSATFNIDLSLRRAEAVADALIDRGIGADRIHTRGYGEVYPVASNKTAAGRQQNRRVEIIILKAGADVAKMQRE